METLSALFALIETLERAPAVFRRSLKSIVQDLRLLRFTDDGVLVALQQLADGEQMDATAIAALNSFNDREWNVRDAIRRLAEDVDRGRGLTSQSTAQKVEMLAYGKADVRRDVQQLINNYGRPHGNPDRAKIRTMIAGIRELNQRLSDAEDFLLHGARPEF